jgi:hypothetical protein
MIGSMKAKSTSLLRSRHHSQLRQITSPAYVLRLHHTSDLGLNPRPPQGEPPSKPASRDGRPANVGM